VTKLKKKGKGKHNKKKGGKGKKPSDKVKGTPGGEERKRTCKKKPSTSPRVGDGRELDEEWAKRDTDEAGDHKGSP